jgi:EAL domain-containing protein (putative c-di-GMP-specific phosphodiesterase class I)/GGDEF domain-containing protein
MRATSNESHGTCGYPPSFVSTLESQLASARKSGKKIGLTFVSIDNLMMVVSGYGIAIAEQVMVELRALIAQHFPEDSHVSRVQRDQFAVIVTDASESQNALLTEMLIERIRHFSHASPYGALHFIASTSTAISSDEGTTASDLIAHALVRLMEDSDRPTFLKDSSEYSREEMGLANYLSQAVIKKRLRMAYQPVIRSSDGAISHYEALLRLHNEDGKITSAGALIPVAERMGMIQLIDELTLDMVVQELRNHSSISLAVNVSNVTTHDGTWLARVKHYIEETPHIAPRMIVELTETAVYSDLKHTAYFCAELQSLGCLIALDDFGSGYTSFRQLKSLSVDMVKIDGAFVRDLTDNADNRFFVKTLLDFTKGFGLKSVAEFVENGETAKMLMELGVDYLQGYYFGAPYNYRHWLNEGEYAATTTVDAD